MGPSLILTWLAHAAVVGSLCLLAGCLAVRCCRQPVRRIRLIALTLAGALLAPGLGQLPWLPHWSVGWLPAEAEPAVVEVVETPRMSMEVALPVQAPVVEAPAEIVAPAAEAGWPRVSAEAVVLLVYGGIAGAMLAWVGVGLGALWALSRRARATTPEVVALFREVAGPAGRGVRLLVSDAVALPLTYRLWRPVIVLPRALCEEGSEAELRYCLAHEWSHIERGDLGRWYLATLAQLAFFYQPLFWWLRAQLRLCQDYLADARAAEQATEAADYAAYLVRLARQQARTPAAALGMAERGSHLFRRVTMLLTREPLEHCCHWSWNAAVVGGAVLLLGVFSLVRLDAARPPQEKQEIKEAPKAPESAEDLHYTGRVTDKDSGKPIPDAVVTVRRSLYGDPEVKEHDKVVEATKHTTDAEGKYDFVIPAAQAAKRYLYIELDVEADDYAPRKGFGYALSMIRKNEKLGGRPFFEHVELRPAQAITGKLLTPVGEPAAGVRLLAYSNTDQKGDRFEYGSFADAKTDVQGRFRLLLITPGPAVFWILPEKFAPSTHGLRGNKRGDLGTFTLRPGLQVHGKVLDVHGKPLPNVIVNAEATQRSEELPNLPVADHINRSAVTDAKGEFRLAPLPPGEYRLQPGEYARDGSLERHVRLQVPAVFVGQKVVLKDGDEPPAIEVRAVPHVVIEAQYYDGKGKPSRGHECFIFGRIDNQSWFGQGKPSADGKIVAQAPHGLEDAQLDLMTNEHGVLRWRKGKDDKLHSNRRVKLGTLNEDVKGLELIHYKAPILVINGVDEARQQVKGFKARINYEPGRVEKEGGTFVNGVKGDVYLEHQEDGRWRSSQLFPDEPVTITVSADGYTAGTQKMELKEAEIKEINVTLKKN